MKLYKEVYRHAGTTTIKETFFNKGKQTIATLDTYKDTNAGTHSAELTLCIHTGESYQLSRYSHTTETYKRFEKAGPALLATANWHNVKEAHYIKECKVEKGVVLEEHTHNIAYEEKDSVKYTYNNGRMVSEKRVLADGSIITTNYVYDSKGATLSKAVLKNDIFQSQVNYLYQNNGLLALEQTFHSHKGLKFLAAEKKYLYNTKNQVEKTTWYGRYNGQLYLYKTTEAILDKDRLTKKSAGISALEIAIGYYDLDALHQYFRENKMEGYIPYFDKDFIANNKFTPLQHTVEKLDQQGNPVETRLMNPEKPEEQLTMATYRNEYNEADGLEFVITYIQNDQNQQEENSIKKFYYRED
ncbi:hypothetical protein [Chitinophaga sp. sic0106]|uniref:hypothetical protein n=1 Tax=Chitinophaga sp. sic0106 TaxID=2854785 RepID=UPI001C452B40|nr:hypothetical protein [Chitinophaga sp. sic0106]MBV7530942.1 hypothetical protein [Chitinophaga sp. sic0106]